MNWILISAPLMLLAVAAAVVPLLVAMVHQQRHDLAPAPAATRRPLPMPTNAAAVHTVPVHVAHGATAPLDRAA